MADVSCVSLAHVYPCHATAKHWVWAPKRVECVAQTKVGYWFNSRNATRHHHYMCLCPFRNVSQLPAINSCKTLCKQPQSCTQLSQLFSASLAKVNKSCSALVLPLLLFNYRSLHQIIPQSERHQVSADSNGKFDHHWIKCQQDSSRIETIQAIWTFGCDFDNQVPRRSESFREFNYHLNKTSNWFQ